MANDTANCNVEVNFPARRCCLRTSSAKSCVKRELPRPSACETPKQAHGRKLVVAKRKLVDQIPDTVRQWIGCKPLLRTLALSGLNTRCSSPRTARGPKYTFQRNLKSLDSKSDVYHLLICGGKQAQGSEQVCHRKFDKPTITQLIGAQKGSTQKENTLWCLLSLRVHMVCVMKCGGGPAQPTYHHQSTKDHEEIRKILRV